MGDNGKEDGLQLAMLRLVEQRLKSISSSEYEIFKKLDNEGKLVYIDQHQDILNVGFDADLLIEINKILHPLLEKVMTVELKKEIYHDQAARYFLAMDNVIEFRTVMWKYAQNISPRTPDEESRLSLPYYLMIVESVFTQDLDNLVYLLIKNYVAYQGKKKKTINTMNEIREESLYKKLTFLNDNGFSLISDICDRDLRNSIAHMNFILNSDGSVQYNNNVNGISKIELENKIEKTLNVCHCLSESYMQFFGKQLGLTY